MRPALLLALLPLLAACEDRRDFDQRYRDTAAEIEKKERALTVNEPSDPPTATP